MNAVILNEVGKRYAVYRHGFDRLRELVSGRPRHQAFHALKPLSLSIRQGEVVGLVGRNGAGKSTLLKLIAKTLTPTQGEIEVNGQVAALLELGTGFHPEMSGRENVFLSGSIMGLSNAEVEALYDEIVAFADIREFMDQPVKTYSSGMLMRLGFAVATCVDPDILIIDEALSVGDGAFARKSFDRIMEFKRKGTTILFCSHSMYQVEAICSRVIWLDRGEARLDGDPATVVSAYSASLGGSVPEADGEEDSMGTSLPPASTRGSARLSKVRVAVDGQSGYEQVVMSEGSDVRVSVDFLSDPSLPAPMVGVAFTGEDGRIVASAGSKGDGIVLDRHPDGSGYVVVLFPRFPLLKGRYGVNVYLLCEEGIHIYDHALQVAELQVRQKGLERGVVILPREWSQPTETSSTGELVDASNG